MSDQELSDIVFYIQSQPAGPCRTGPDARPLGKVLLATGKFRLSAEANSGI